MKNNDKWKRSESCQNWVRRQGQPLAEHDARRNASLIHTRALSENHRRGIHRRSMDAQKPKIKKQET